MTGMENTLENSLSASTAAGLQRWKSLVEARAWDQLPDLLADGFVYHNPTALEPLRGKDVVVAVLVAVFTVMQDFTYLRSFGSDAGQVKEFSARIGDEPVFGVDILTFDEADKIAELIVMMRPAGTVQTLASEAGKILGLTHRED